MPEDETDHQTEQTPKAVTVPVPKHDEFFGNLAKTTPPAASDADRTLVRAWCLSNEDHTDEVIDEFERLLPSLLAAGYAETDDDTDSWCFSDNGIARADELVPDQEASSGLPPERAES